MQHAPAARPSPTPAPHLPRGTATRPLPGTTTSSHRTTTASHHTATRPLLAVAIAAVLALAASACVGGGRGTEGQDGPVPPTAQSPAVLPSAELPPVLTRGQARAALVGADDLGETWEPTRGAATWRDELLKATAELPDCRRLLDVLYTEELFGTGAATAPRATAALDDVDGGAQLHYRVTSYRAADLDRTLAWLGTLPDMCGRFEARDAHGTARDVRVTGLTLPEAGDARRGLRVTVGDTAPDDGEDPRADTQTGPRADTGTDTAGGVLTVDLVAVRVGDDAISLTNGTLGTPADDATRTSVEVGADRLTEARRQGRAQV
ncbi:hypothetical protein ACWEWD_12235 [Streptomyces tendae]